MMLLPLAQYVVTSNNVYHRFDVLKFSTIPNQFQCCSRRQNRQSKPEIQITVCGCSRGSTEIYIGLNEW